MSFVDMSLDQIISEKKTEKRANKPKAGKGKGQRGRSQGKGGRSMSRGRSQSRKGGGKGWGRQAGGGGAYSGSFGGFGFRSNPYGRSQSRARSVSQRRPGGGGGDNRVLVANCPAGWSEQEVLDVMQTVGRVNRITFYSDEYGKPTGTATVQYGSPQSARAAVRELDDASLGGTYIRVALERSRLNRGGGGGKGWGGGGKGMNTPVWVPASFFKGWGGGKGFGGGGRKGGRARSQSRGPRNFGRQGKGGRRGGKGGRVTRSQLSKGDLDAQLEKFIS